MEKIKIAFFADILLEDLDGASRTMFQIIRRIPKEKYEFKFFTGVPPTASMDYEVIKVPNVTIPFNSTYKAALPFLAKGRLTKKLDAFKPDIIHIASPSPLGNFAIKYGKKNSVPIITIYHTHFMSYVEYYLRFVPWLIKWGTKKIVASTKRFYESCDKALLPTQMVVDEFKDIGIDTSNAVLWGRGIDRKLFNPIKKDKEKIIEITGSSKPKLLFVSRLVWEKNLRTLINLYSYFEERGAPYDFVIVGDGVAKETLAKEMPTAYFTGTVDHETAAFYYASSDVFVFPSISESYGNVIIEAMSSGLPTVAANGGGSVSLIKNGKNGILVEPNDVREYAEKIEWLMKNQEAKNAIISSGLEHTKNLSWDNLTEAYFGHVCSLRPQNH